MDNQVIAANQKFCHGCAKPIHQSAISCPFCGAPQGGSVPSVQSHTTMPGGAQTRMTSDQQFCGKCGTVMHVTASNCPSCGAAQTEFASNWGKSRKTAGWLALLAGGLGAHHFYLGNYVWGALYLIFVWTAVPTVLALIDAIRYFNMSDKEFEIKYRK